MIGIRELLDLDNDLIGGETSAIVLAERHGLSVRTVERRRTHLRKQGHRCPAPEQEVRGKEKRRQGGCW